MARLIGNPKNKETLSSTGRFGFLTEPTQSVPLILKFTISFALMLIACTGPISIVFAQPENMPQNPQEHWYNIALSNTKIGYMHLSTEKTDYQGEEVDRHKIDMVMNFKALGTDVTLEITRVEYTGPDLMPRHFLSTSNESGPKTGGRTHRRRSGTH